MLPILPIKGFRMNELTVVEKTNEWRRMKSLVLDSVSSPITKRVYNMALGSQDRALLVAAGEQEDLRPFFAPRERGWTLGFSAIPLSQNGQPFGTQLFCSRGTFRDRLLGQKPSSGCSRYSASAEELIRLVVSQMRAFWDGGTAKEPKAALGYCETKKR